MVEVAQPDKKWVERKRKGEQIKAFLNSNVFLTVIEPFIEGTKQESIKAAYLVVDNHAKLASCVSWHQCLSVVMDSLRTAAKDAEIDLQNPPEEGGEAPNIEQ